LNRFYTEIGKRKLAGIAGRNSAGQQKANTNERITEFCDGLVLNALLDGTDVKMVFDTGSTQCSVTLINPKLIREIRADQKYTGICVETSENGNWTNDCNIWNS
jgi:predicted aspartyl protease